MNATPEGEHTMRYIADTLSPLVDQKHLKISYLGRGLSTGTELEYSDKETLKNALERRT
jgi:recombinational DNA repair protein RecR